jgi:hypothetical protein
MTLARNFKCLEAVYKEYIPALWCKGDADSWWWNRRFPSFMIREKGQGGPGFIVSRELRPSLQRCMYSFKGVDV